MFTLRPRILLLSLYLFTIQCSSTPNPKPTLHPRQDAETRTVDPLTSSLQLQGDTTSVVPSRTTSYRLVTATAPIQLADTIGLIMPNPWSKVYVGLNYSLGFVDVVPRPAPTVGGWLRQIQPLLKLPNNRVNVFPSNGHHEVDEEGAVPLGSDGLCGFTAENYAISYPFTFQEPGWYMLIINQTMLQPSISSDHTCQNPMISQDTFFATQSFSVQPRPTDNLKGFASPSAYTVFADVSREMPGRLPIDPQKMTPHEKLAVGLGVSAGILAFIGMIAAIIIIRKRRRDHDEVVAFNRLSETAKAEFLADNPNSRLNPNHPRNTRQGRAADSFSNRPLAAPGTMAYQQWYWDHLMRSQAQAQAQGQGQAVHGQGQDQGLMQPMMQNHAQMGFHSLPAYNPHLQAGYHGQSEWNNGPLPPLPNHPPPPQMGQYGGGVPGYGPIDPAQMGQIPGYMQGYPAR